MKSIGSSSPGTPFTYARLAAVGAVALLAAGQWGACMNGGTLTDDQCNDLVGTDCDSPIGGGGGNSGTGGMPVPSADCGDGEALRTAALPNCPAHADVTAFEKDFIIPKCGTKIGQDSCHSRGTLFPPVLSGVDLWKAIAGKKSKAKVPMCADDFWADVEDGSKGMFFTKTVMDKPTCNDGELSGDRMPRNEDALTVEETACLTDYLAAIAENCN